MDEPDTSLSGSNDDTSGDTRHPARVARRRLAVLLGAAAIAALAGAIALNRGDDAPPPLTQIPVDGWAPYWAMDRSIDDLDRHGEVLREVSPFAFEATAVDRIDLPENIDVELIPSFISAARAEGLAITPSIIDGLDSGEMAAILGSPRLRARHVTAIVELAEQLDVDGIDIDYESFAFLDDRATWPTTRLAFADFIDELAVALRDDGRRLVVSVPPVYDDATNESSGYWVYDMARLAESADTIRVMAYGYSGLDAGPVSPIEWVERSIEGVVSAAGRRDKVVLGVPLYGTNVPTSTVGRCPADAPGVVAVTLRSIDALIERRNAQPVFDESTEEWSFSYDLDVEAGDGTVACTQSRLVTYVDAAGARARIDLALEHRLAGVALWALGYEDDVFWDLLTPVAQ